MRTSDRQHHFLAIMQLTKHFFVFLLALISFASCSKLAVEIVHPTVEQQDGSRALATAQPRFSWNYETTENKMVQQSYRIIVATS